MAIDPANTEARAPAARRSLVLARLALLALPLLLVHRGLLPERTILPSLPGAHAPWDERAAPERTAPAPELVDAWAIHRAVRSGSLPTWNPWSELGGPLAATARLGAFHPPNLALWIAPPARARAWLALVALALAGVFGALWLEREGLSRVAALVGALALQSAPWALARLPTGEPELDVCLVLPLGLWALAGLRRDLARSGAWLALAVALACTAGELVSSALVLAALTARALCARETRVRALGWLALGLAGGAIELVPRFEALALWEAAAAAVAAAHADGPSLLERIGGGVPLALWALALLLRRPPAGAAIGTGGSLAIAGLVLERLGLAQGLGLAWVGWATIAASSLEALGGRFPSAAARSALFAVACAALVAQTLPAGGVLEARSLPPEGALPEQGFARALALVAGDGRALVLDEGARSLVPAGVLPALGIEELGGAPARRDPALACVLDLFVRPDEETRTPGATPLGTPRVLDSPLFDLLDVRAGLASAARGHRRLELAARGNGVLALARSGALGAARHVPGAVLAENARTAQAMLLEATIDPRAAAIATSEDLGPLPLVPGGAATASAPSALVVRSPAPHRMEALVEGASGGWIVFSGSPYPGWKANVNGVDAPVVRLDAVLRAVPLSEAPKDGRHIVRTWFEPWSLRIGCATSALAFVVWLFALSRGRRGSRTLSSGDAPQGPVVG